MYLTNGVELPISRSYKEEVQKRLLNEGLGKDNNGNLRNNIQIFIQYIECVCWISFDRVISCKQKK